jgi:hypothetical protein
MTPDQLANLRREAVDALANHPNDPDLNVVAVPCADLLGLLDERDRLAARVLELEAPGECQSMHKLRAEVEAERDEARALRDALTAAMGETSEPCPRCAARDYMRDPDGFVEVPDASVASEGPAKGAGPSKRGLPTVAECADEDCDRCAGTGRIDNSDRGGALETCSCVVFCEVCHWPRRPMVYGSAPCGVCAGAP